MKRLLLILAMVVIPAQAALALVCNYCVHRADDVQVHGFAHGGGVSVEESQHVDDGPASPTASFECSVCHAGHASMSVDCVVGADAKAGGDRPSQAPSRYRPRLPDRIERVPLPAVA